MKRLLITLVTLFLLISLSACGNSSDNSSKPKELTKKQIKDKIQEIDYWLVDYWNDAVCDIYHFTEDGKNSVGETMDVDITMKQYSKHFTKANDYNIFITSLNNDYEDIKFAWDKIYTQMMIIDEYIKNHGIVEDKDNSLDTGLFTQAMNLFSDYAYELYSQ